MALACLPMYDLPEVQPALAGLWAGIARQLRCQGLADVPAGLADEQPADAVWSTPDLLLSQCCGADLVGAWAVNPATARHALLPRAGLRGRRVIRASS